MKRFLICVSIACVGSPLAAYATIYRCTDGATVTYQDMPCKKGQASELIIASLETDAKSESQTDRASTIETQSSTASRVARRNAGLTLGMLDTHVLNLRSWGRPAKIKRTKLPRAWREEWTYQSPQEGERQLEFANGKLTAIW
jgi:hypothetical protein